MKDYGIDLLEMMWVDYHNALHRLTLRATTMEGVMMIRCATQDSSFPILGQLQPDPSRGPRTYDSAMWKINPASIQFTPTNDNYLESFLVAERIFVCVKMTVNVYHQRDDLRQIIQHRPDLFQMVRYERSSQGFFLQARGEKKADNWDALLAALSEAEFNVRDEYEDAFFQQLESV